MSDDLLNRIEFLEHKLIALTEAYFSMAMINGLVLRDYCDHLADELKDRADDGRIRCDPAFLYSLADQVRGLADGLSRLPVTPADEAPSDGEPEPPAAPQPR